MKWIKELLPYVIIIIVVILIRTFIVTPVIVDGTSMTPTLADNQVLILKKYDKSYKRFDIAVLDYNGTRLVKRVVGLPGEEVEYKQGKLYINGKEIKENFKHGKTTDFVLEQVGYDKIPKDYYFVMGDNRTNSTDSRTVGLIHKSDILGETNFSLFPFNRFGSIK